jgi:hypothetical protein
MPDQSMFSEIPDNTAKYEALGFGGTSPGNAHYAYQHPELFEQYPDLKNVAIQDVPGRNKGSFDSANNRMELGVDEGVTSSAAHEFQHAIQNKESWAKGGNPSQFIKELAQQYNMDEPTLLNALAHEKYRKLTGEAQARATQDRLHMDNDARRNNYPLKGNKLSDVLLKDLINRY